MTKPKTGFVMFTSAISSSRRFPKKIGEKGTKLILDEFLEPLGERKMIVPVRIDERCLYFPVKNCFLKPGDVVDVYWDDSLEILSIMLGSTMKVEKAPGNMAKINLADWPEGDRYPGNVKFGMDVFESEAWVYLGRKYDFTKARARLSGGKHVGSIYTGLWERLKERAEFEKKSVSELLTRAVERYLEDAGWSWEE